MDIARPLIRGAIFDTSNWMAAVTQLYNHYVTDDYWYYEGRVSALDHLRAGNHLGVHYWRPAAL